MITAFDKPQATINEESEGNAPNDKARDVELPHNIGDQSFLYHS